MDKKLTFTYDYMGRRVEKKVYRYDTGASDWEADPNSWTRWVYYDWLPIIEYDVNPSTEALTLVRKFTWGLDLAGQSGSQSITAAGGIGGLVATRDEDASASFVHFYDGNGNVTQMIDRSDDSTAAHYAYDAYGNVIASSGSYADDNVWRFSTKQWDDETGLGYWGERYYDGGDGRWVNRDPIGEDGGFGLYVYGFNDVLNTFDRIGREAVGGPSGPPPVGNPTSCPKNPDCSDCGQTCETAAAQNALGTDDAGVICRTDGCRCACANKSKLPGGPPGSPEEILKQCALAHEQEHVRQSSTSIWREWYYPCNERHRQAGVRIVESACGKRRRPPGRSDPPIPPPRRNEPKP
jgi:RHS repeat-associated protein